MKKYLCFLMMLFLFTGMIPGASAAEASKLVIMLYMTGGDLESNGGAASDDLEEIMQYLPSDENIRIVAMIAGANKWRLDISREEASVYEVTRDGLVVAEKRPSQNMGLPETLSEFISSVKSRFPADQYGLIIWDHGAGPLVGVCFDEVYKSDEIMDRLTLEELSKALSAGIFGREKLSFIGFDACLMASMEVAATVSPYAEYMIASQETEPTTGWNYAFLRDLTGDEKGDEIGKRIIAAYADFQNDSSRPVTLSCLDLDKNDEVCALLGSFFADLEPKITEESYPALTRCRALSKSLGNSTRSQYDLIDLLDLISLYQNDNIADASALSSALNDMIVCNFAKNDDYVNGVSIYYPFDNKAEYESPWASIYGNLDFVPEYKAFIKKISDIYIGEALLDWKSSYQVKLQEEAGTVKLTADMTPEELKNLARARLIVLEEIQEGVYQLVFLDYDDLRYFEDAISASYHGEALYQVSPEGEILAGPITYYPVDNGIAVYGIITYDFDWDIPYTEQKKPDAAQLIYRQDENGVLSLSDVMIIEDSQSGLRLPSAVDLTKCLELQLINSGPVGGPESVTSLEYVLLNDIRIDPSDGTPLLAFLPVYGSNNRYAYLRFTDIQGQTVISDVTEIHNPTLVSIAKEQEIEQNDRFQVSLQSAELVTGYNSGIKCVFRMKNRSDKPFRCKVRGTAIDSVQIDKYLWYPMSFLPGEEDDIIVFINGDSIRKTNLQEASLMTAVLQVENDEGSSEEIKLDFPVQLNTSLFNVSK